MDWFGHPWYVWVLIVLVTGLAWGFATALGSHLASVLISAPARPRKEP